MRYLPLNSGQHQEGETTTTQDDQHNFVKAKEGKKAHTYGFLVWEKSRAIALRSEKDPAGEGRMYPSLDAVGIEPTEHRNLRSHNTQPQYENLPTLRPGLRFG